MSKGFRELSGQIGNHIKRTKENDIIMRTPFICWQMTPYKTKGLVIALHNVGGQRIHRLKLNIPDDHKIATSFSSIFVQGGDALILHYIYLLVDKINKKLQKEGISKINLYANHDTFGVNDEYGFFLDYIVREGYIKLYNFNYLQEFANQIKDDEKLKEQVLALIEKETTKDGKKNPLFQTEELNNPYIIKW